LIKAKKSLGQNFLIDKNILEKIVSCTKIENRTVLEVGPGTGNLTSYILKQKPKKVIVIEKDNNLSLQLKDIFDNQNTYNQQEIFLKLMKVY
jgi:Dimethyladenosine transferase (rRNA methylation)